MTSSTPPGRTAQDSKRHPFGGQDFMQKRGTKETPGPFLASKKTDDLSRHESATVPKKDQKKDPKPDPKSGFGDKPISEHPDVLHPHKNHREGGKPISGPARKS